MDESITAVQDFSRLDQFITTQNRTRSRAANLIRDGFVAVNGLKENKPSRPVHAGDRIVITEPELKDTENAAQDIPIDILYQDDAIAVIVKPAGMVTHPAAGNPDGTLVNALLFNLDHLSGIGGEKRPGIVHRLDKDTSGVMLVAKNDAAHLFLSSELSERHMEKHYHAIVCGCMKEQCGVIEQPIGRSRQDRKKMAVDPEGRYAFTEWRVIREGRDRTLLDVHIVTGRTHQIRVHMRHIGHPVLGDPLYGFHNMPKADRLMLHAYSVSFTHPVTGERMTFTAPCPFDDLV